MHDETAMPSSRKLLKGGLIILLIVVMAFSAGVGYAFERIEMLFYPRHYANEVDEAAAKFGIEPNLIYAIIKAESDFVETAVSSSGAIGLMQVLPDTFISDIRDHIGLDASGSAVLFQAKENILAGSTLKLLTAIKNMSNLTNLQTAINMATINPAKALNLNKNIGGYKNESTCSWSRCHRRYRCRTS